MRTTLLLLLSMVSVSAFAVQEYYSISRSYRALGMGGAYYGLSDDEGALFYNPASLSLYPGGAQLMVSLDSQAANSSFAAYSGIASSMKGSSSVSNIVDAMTKYSGKPLTVGVRALPYFLSRGFALGALVADTKVGLSLLGRDFNSALDLTAISDTGVFMAFAGKITPGLHLGVTSKAIYRIGGHKYFQVTDLVQGSSLSLAALGGGGFGVDFDLGLSYELPLPSGKRGGVSLVFNNLLASTFPIARTQGAPPGLPRMVSLGSYLLLPGGKHLDYFKLMLDLSEFQIGGESDPDKGARTGSFFKHVNLGAELPLGGWFALRAGLHQGDWTAGVGITAYAIKMDFATYGEELFSGVGRLTSRRYAVRVAFGFGAPSYSRLPAGSPSGKK